MDPARPSDEHHDPGAQGSEGEARAGMKLLLVDDQNRPAALEYFSGGDQSGQPCPHDDDVSIHGATLAPLPSRRVG